MRKILNLFLVLSLIGLMSSCILTEDGKLTNEIQVSGIVINPTSLSLDVASKHKLIAAVIPIQLNKNIFWESLSPDVATVNLNGVVTAIKKGTAIIIARVDNVTASCTVNVTGEGGGDKPVIDIPKLNEIFTGNLTVSENTSGDWWVDVNVPNFTCEFVEELEKGVFVFNMKGFWYAQMEGAEANNWAKTGDNVEYYSIPVTINVQDPNNPTYTVGLNEEGNAHCILTVNEGIQDKEWWVGFQPVDNKKIEIDYDNKQMTFHYNVSAGENGKWNLDYDFVLTMIWD